MQFLNPKISRDLEEGKSIKLDLGSGGPGREGFYSVDLLPLKGVDIVADLNRPFSLLCDNCVDQIYSRHALEHVREFLPLMRELYRITKPGGELEIIVPHFSNVYGYSDPTHVRFFGLYTMYYFVPEDSQPKLRKVPSFYTDVKFRIESVRIEFDRLGIIDMMLAPLLSMVVNRSLSWQDFYERRLANFFHASQLRYRMKPDKENARYQP